MRLMCFCIRSDGSIVVFKVVYLGLPSVQVGTGQVFGSTLIVVPTTETTTETIDHCQKNFIRIISITHRYCSIYFKKCIN